MDTVSHAFWAFFATREKKWKWQSVCFSILPDVPRLFGIAYWVLLGLGYHAALEMSVRSFETIFSIAFHSLVVVAIFALLWFCFRRAWPIGALVGWLLHIVLDILTHGGDAQPIFWPLSDFSISSPVSYYRLDYFAGFFVVANVALIVLVIAWMVWKRKRKA
ncbi:MAG: hypothetical protein V1847_03350 [Candidatus Diapherotrites archaeon]